MNGFTRGVLGLAILAGFFAANGLSGCATGTTIDGPATVPGDDVDGSTSSTDQDGGNTIAPDTDSGSNVQPGTDSGTPGKDSGTTGPCVGVVVINEVQADGASASDEFVELYNTQPCSLSLNKYSVNYSSSSGSSPQAYFTGGPGDSIPANGYFLIKGTGYAGASNGTLSGGLAAAAGRVGITDGNSKLLDSVAYGTQSGSNTYVEKNPAASPPSKKSVGRLPNGKDTDNNATDFAVLTSPSPGAVNQ